MKRKIKLAALYTLLAIALLMLAPICHYRDVGADRIVMQLLAVQWAFIFLGIVIHFVVDADKEPKQDEKDRFINDNLNR